MHHHNYHLRHHVTLPHISDNNGQDNNDLNNNNNMSPTKKDDKEELVGSLLVHSSDLKELSTKTECPKDECVGTLLVHQCDVQELSNVESPKIVRRMTERVAKAIEKVPETIIDPDDDILEWQCGV
jgi:hypothetical protein